MILSNKKNQTIVLLFHSLTSVPEETSLLAGFFVTQGYVTKSILLAGHGRDVRSLQNVHYQDWVQQVLQEYDEAAKKFARVAVAGFSMGGLLALTLSALRDPLFCVAIAPALVTKRRSARLAGLLRFFKGGIRNRVLEQFKEWYLPIMPFAAIRETLRLARYLKKQVPAIKCPLMLFHSLTDRVIDPISSRILYHTSYTPEKELLFFSRGAHLLMLPGLATTEPAFSRLYDFLERSNLLPAD